ncbi:MAG: glycosyltransferase [Candidatus Aminicenantes bacterium]|nr:glycosyltransferase [Candidatus Aminicenantes bacterium]
MEDARVALVHDWLTGQRGGEKVLEVLVEIFSQAPVYTLFHFPKSQVEEVEKREIKTSFLQRLPFLRKKYRFYLPLFPLAAELFDLQDYDMVISTSHCVAKGIIPHPEALHVCYIHSPMRYAWNQYFPYFSASKLSFLSKLIIPPLIHHLRMWDESSSSRVDHFLANSKNVAQRVEKYYRRQAEVLHPPVETDFFQPGKETEDFYLIVSALVPYKRIDLAIEAFNQLGVSLKIIGQGPDYKKLKKSAKENVQFLGALEAEELLQFYQKARALVLPGEEDFGITSLEAQACGIPVIAYGRGGALESVVPRETGLFFPELKVESLLSVLDKFKSMEFNKSVIRENAMGFSRGIFKEKISSYLREKWSVFRDKR